MSSVTERTLAIISGSRYVTGIHHDACRSSRSVQCHVKTATIVIQHDHIVERRDERQAEETSDNAGRRGERLGATLKSRHGCDTHRLEYMGVVLRANRHTLLHCVPAVVCLVVVCVASASVLSQKSGLARSRRRLLRERDSVHVPRTVLVPTSTSVDRERSRARLSPRITTSQRQVQRLLTCRPLRVRILLVGSTVRHLGTPCVR